MWIGRMNITFENLLCVTMYFVIGIDIESAVHTQNSLISQNSFDLSTIPLFVFSSNKEKQNDKCLYQKWLKRTAWHNSNAPRRNSTEEYASVELLACVPPTAKLKSIALHQFCLTYGLTFRWPSSIYHPEHSRSDFKWENKYSIFRG